MSHSSYLMKQPCRTLQAVTADTQHHSFLVGTSHVAGPNEIRLLRRVGGDGLIQCAAKYSHPDEIISLSSCSTDASLVLTVYSVGSQLRSTIWRMPEADELPTDDIGDDVAAKDLEVVAHLPDLPRGCRVMHAQWLPSSSESASVEGAGIVTAEDTAVKCWKLNEGGRLQLVNEFPMDDVSFVGGLAWDSLHPTEIALAADSSIHCWDLKSKARTRTIKNAVPAGGVVRTLSYNVNKPWHLASGGDDSRVHIWDVRKPDIPVKILEGHTHWVTSVAFNTFHDQLLVSGGSDGRVNLWRVSSISSAPLLELGEDELGEGAKRQETRQAADICVKSMEDHDDSVCGVAWSAESAWVYASLSYSGKVIISEVPSAEKYKILL